MSRADMESASPRRHTLQAAVLKPEELSALSGVGGTRLAMMVDQTCRKGRGDGGEEGSLFLIGRQTLASLSGGQGKALSACLPGQPGRFVKRRVVAQRGVADARELVGQGAGGLVVVAAGLDIERPAADAADVFAGTFGHLGCSQHTARTVGEQHAQIAVAFLGDAAQVPTAARAVLARRQAEPAGEVARVLEVGHITGSGGHQGGGGEQPDAGHGQQQRAGGAVTGHSGQLAFDLGNARFEQADLFEQHAGGMPNQIRQGRARIGQHTGDRLHAGARALRDGDAELAAEASQGIDARGACAHPERADAMQTLQGLLLQRLHANGTDVRGASGFEQGGGIGGVGLVAPRVGAHVLGGQQTHLNAQAIEPASPMVGRATGFHDDQINGSVGEPALELAARQALGINEPPLVVSDGELKTDLARSTATVVACISDSFRLCKT